MIVDNKFYFIELTNNLINMIEEEKQLLNNLSENNNKDIYKSLLKHKKILIKEWESLSKNENQLKDKKLLKKLSYSTNKLKEKVLYKQVELNEINIMMNNILVQNL